MYPATITYKLDCATKNIKITEKASRIPKSGFETMHSEGRTFTRAHQDAFLIPRSYIKNPIFLS